MKPKATGGGWPAIGYALRIARRSGGLLRFLRSLSTPNACKTCALGMGGQSGGMVDEAGRFPEVCKKSMQAMAADMQGRISEKFFASYDLEALRQFSSRDLEHMGRLVEPVFAGPRDRNYRSISWDEAIARCVGHLKNLPPDRAFFYSSGRSSNEAGFLLQLFARLYGTNNVNNCSYYCHQASGVGLSSVLGSGTGTVELDDFAKSDLVFLIGGNPASNHPRLMRQLVNLRRRGGQVVVVNPLREVGLVNFSVPSDVRSLLFGSEIAGYYLQPHIGGDRALFSAIAKRIDELDRVDEAFVEHCTEGGAALREHLRVQPWAELLERSGVDRRAVDEVARLYADARSVIFAWTMGITHHVHGVDNVRSIANLALLRGMVGRPGAGLLPIRGHSNVQGIGSMGVTPKLKEAVFDRLESHFGVKPPTTPGLDTLSCLEAMQAGALRAGWCLGGNLFGSNPDACRTEAAFRELDSIVYFNTTLNTGHVRGRAKETIILPVLARDEEPQPTTQESMFSFVRLSDGGPRRHDGPRSEVEAIASIACGVLGDDGPVNWRAMQTHRNVRVAIGSVISGYEPMTQIDQTRREFVIPGRVLHRPVFSTPSGRAKFHVVSLQGSTDFEGRLRLMTLRSEGQFNTVVYEDEDIYRGQVRRDVILMNPADIQRLKLSIDQRVTVRSSVGTLRGILVREFDIRAGNAAMYYPEANVLVPWDADPESRTPAFKNVSITVEAELAPPQGSRPGSLVSLVTAHS